jgi:hypothetical protein
MLSSSILICNTNYNGNTNMKFYSMYKIEIVLRLLT